MSKPTPEQDNALIFYIKHLIDESFREKGYKSPFSGVDEVVKIESIRFTLDIRLYSKMDEKDWNIYFVNKSFVDNKATVLLSATGYKSPEKDYEIEKETTSYGYNREYLIKELREVLSNATEIDFFKDTRFLTSLPEGYSKNKKKTTMVNDNKTAQKWIFGLNQYVYYELPDNCPLKAMPKNRDMEINCASCRQPTIFSNCYTSKTIRSLDGFGYPVCEECHKAEIEQKRRVKEEE